MLKEQKESKWEIIKFYARRRTWSSSQLGDKTDQDETFGSSTGPIRVYMNDEITHSSFFNLTTVALSIFGFDALLLSWLIFAFFSYSVTNVF